MDLERMRQLADNLEKEQPVKKEKKKVIDDIRRKEHVNGRNRIPARA